MIHLKNFNGQINLSKIIELSKFSKANNVQARKIKKITI